MEVRFHYQWVTQELTLWSVGTIGYQPEDEPKEKKGRGIRLVREIKRQKLERIGEAVPDVSDGAVELEISHLLPPRPGTITSTVPSYKHGRTEPGARMAPRKHRLPFSPGYRSPDHPAKANHEDVDRQVLYTTVLREVRPRTAGNLSLSIFHAAWRQRRLVRPID